MEIKIITVGKLKEKYLKMGIEEYTKRLKKYTKVTLIEVPDEKAPETLSDKEMIQVKDKEGERILNKIADHDFVFALAILGKNYDSVSFAKKIASLQTHGHSTITFVIGGSLGLSDAVMKRADATISFGALTYPHQLMKLILCEQIYRAFRINHNEPYHK